MLTSLFNIFAVLLINFGRFCITDYLYVKFVENDKAGQNDLVKKTTRNYRP